MRVRACVRTRACSSPRGAAGPPWDSAGGLTAEAVQGAALALERVDHVHCGHGLAARVLGVGHGVAHHVLKEHLVIVGGGRRYV
jgi:hypothetical protein